MSYKEDYERNENRIERIVNACVKKFLYKKTPFELEDLKNAARWYIVKNADKIESLTIKDIVYHAILDLNRSFKKTRLEVVESDIEGNDENESFLNNAKAAEAVDAFTELEAYTYKTRLLRLIKEKLFSASVPQELAQKNLNWYNFVLSFINNGFNAAGIYADLGIDKDATRKALNIFNSKIAPKLSESFKLSLLSGGRGHKFKSDDLEERVIKYILKNGTPRGGGLLGVPRSKIIASLTHKMKAESLKVFNETLENLVENEKIKAVIVNSNRGKTLIYCIVSNKGEINQNEKIFDC